MTDLAIEKKEQPETKVRFEMSAEIGSLIEALAKARKDFKAIIKSETNPFFKSKYADLAGVIDATKDGLSANGLAVLQPPMFERATGTVEIMTLLAHSSGQWIKAILDMPVAKTDAQGVGSAITYGRRYSYSAILNVASESDDDGNGAVSAPKRKETVSQETNEEFDQRTEDQQNITVAQIQEIDKALKRTGKSEEEIEAALGFIHETRIEHIKKGAFQKFLKWANGTSKAKGPSPTDQARIRANKTLWGIAAERSVPEEDVKRYAYEKYGVDSMTQLTAEQLLETAHWIESL
jgi:hypothetical protein